MIVSFRDKRTRDFAGGKYVKAFSGFSRQAELKLDQIDAATTLKDLAALPGNHLERCAPNIAPRNLLRPSTAGNVKMRTCPQPARRPGGLTRVNP
jgi:proteic killer suppression protein